MSLVAGTRRMDGFLALVRTQAAPLDWEALSLAAAQAMREAGGGLEPPGTAYADTNMVFLGTRAGPVTDAALEVGGDGTLAYLDGPLALLDGSVTVGPGQDRQNVDGRIASLKSALQATVSGRPGLEHLSGSFHGLVYEPGTGRTVVVTDRLGSRPVFVAQTSSLLCFSSDIRFLLALSFVDSTLDLEGLVQLVRMQMILEERTLYRAIQVLPPATWLCVDHRAGAVSRNRYWAMTPLAPFRTQEEAIEATAHAFGRATRRILAGSRRIGILLSGGLDSRMLLACLQGDEEQDFAAYTFEVAPSDEGPVAEQLARTVGLKWTRVAQDVGTYWEHMPAALAASQGLYSLCHTHTFYTASIMAADGFDTALNGWGIDLPYSGSYLPKEQFGLLGRELYTHRLGRLRDARGAFGHLLRLLDIQYGNFGWSMLGEPLQPLWEKAVPEALWRVVNQAQLHSSSPYDWVDDALFGFGIAKFRSYPMVTGIRVHLRERNPLFESDVLDVYQRLPYSWRFWGRVFRRALERLNPALVHVRYVNTGVSPLASPLLQVISLQVRAFRRANLSRLRSVAGNLGISLPSARAHGSYPEPLALARSLTGAGPVSALVRRLLAEGPLSSAGVIDAKAVGQAIEDCRTGWRRSGETLLVLATLVLWFDAHPPRDIL